MYSVPGMEVGCAGERAQPENQEILAWASVILLCQMGVWAHPLKETLNWLLGVECGLSWVRSKTQMPPKGPWELGRAGPEV